MGPSSAPTGVGRETWAPQKRRKYQPASEKFSFFAAYKGNFEAEGKKQLLGEHPTKGRSREVKTKMTFEFFKARKRARRGPEAEITENGRIRFNRPAIDKFFGGDVPPRVYLAFDRVRGRIGVLPTLDESPATFKTKKLRSGNFSIPSKPFFKRFNIELPTGGISDINISLESHEGSPLIVLEVDSLKDHSIDK